MFCVDMAACWRRPCHVLAWGGIVPARGVVRTLLATGTVLESTAGMFLRIRSEGYIIRKGKKKQTEKENKMMMMMMMIAKNNY